MIPNEDSYCEIDPDKKDEWGIPVLRFHFKWSEHEEKQAAHMQKTFAEIIEAMGGKVLGNAATRRQKSDRTGRLRSFTKSARPAWASIQKNRS